MIKLKDNVDLQELEKFGFTYDMMQDRWGKHFEEEYLSVYIYTNYRDIRHFHYQGRTCMDGYYKILQELTDAGLVEEIEENSYTKKCEKVLCYIKEHGSINPKQALYELGIMGLKDIISKLQENGLNVNIRTASITNAFGKECIVNEYVLNMEDK